MRINIKDVIVADNFGREKGFLKGSEGLDLEIGENNDFELEMPMSDYVQMNYQFGDRIYIPGTEYGGIIEDRETSTLEDTVFLRGYTWRGMLEYKMIKIPAGQNSLTVTGEANAVIARLMEGWFPNLVHVADEDSGFMITSYIFKDYTDGLTGFTEMLKTVGAKLELVYDQLPYSGRVVIKAVPGNDFSEDIEYSNDNKVHFTTKDYRMGMNHLICLGKGEPKTRIKVDLYMDSDGHVSENQTYYDEQEKIAIYKSDNEEERTKLVEEGTKKLKELWNYKELNMSVQDIDVAIGDVVGGRERITGLYMKKPVTDKILKLDNESYSIEYKVGE